MRCTEVRMVDFQESRGKKHTTYPLLRLIVQISIEIETDDQIIDVFFFLSFPVFVLLSGHVALNALYTIGLIRSNHTSPIRFLLDPYRFCTDQVLLRSKSHLY